MTTHPAQRFAGVDVSADAGYVVVLDGEGRVVDAAVVDITGDILAAVGAVRRVAIDAPDRPSTGPHTADPSLPQKFRTARCAEVALLRGAGFAVPWTTPRNGDVTAGWMEHGFRLWEALRAAGHEPLEAYPHAVFARLAGRPLPPKSRREGREARVGVLRAAGVVEASLPLWGHDGLDAAAAALVALLGERGRAHPVLCAHPRGGGDGSCMWLPDE